MELSSSSVDQFVTCHDEIDAGTETDPACGVVNTCTMVHYGYNFGNKLPLLQHTCRLLPVGWVVEVLDSHGNNLPLQLLPVVLDDANSQVLPVAG